MIGACLLLNVNDAVIVGMRRTPVRMWRCVRRVVRDLPALFTRLLVIGVSRGVECSTWMRSHLLTMMGFRFFPVGGSAVTSIVSTRIMLGVTIGKG